jgi:hypothetical protein
MDYEGVSKARRDTLGAEGRYCIVADAAQLFFNYSVTSLTECSRQSS